MDYENEYAVLPCADCKKAVWMAEMSFMLCRECQEKNHVWDNFATAKPPVAPDTSPATSPPSGS